MKSSGVSVFSCVQDFESFSRLLRDLLVGLFFIPVGNQTNIQRCWKPTLFVRFQLQTFSGFWCRTLRINKQRLDLYQYRALYVQTRWPSVCHTCVILFYSCAWGEFLWSSHRSWVAFLDHGGLFWRVCFSFLWAIGQTWRVVTSSWSLKAEILSV